MTKNFVFILFAACLALPGFGQSDRPVGPAQPAPDSPYRVVDEMPRFPGCEYDSLSVKARKQCADALILQYLRSNMAGPLSKTTDMAGTLVVKFVVEKDGSISNVVIARKFHPDLDQQYLEAVRSMPKWVPGKINGSPAPVAMAWPFKVHLE